jgi:hypothetical protein
VLNDLQAEFGTVPAAEESQKAKCNTAAFPKVFTFRERAGFSCYNVMPFPKNCAPAPCLPLYIKDLLKEDRGLVEEVNGLIGWLWAACEVAAGLFVCL